VHHLWHAVHRDAQAPVLLEHLCRARVPGAETGQGGNGNNAEAAKGEARKEYQVKMNAADLTTSMQVKSRRGRKRGVGEGSIYKRKDGQWTASLMVGRRADGKPDRRVVYGKTRAEVQHKLDDLRRRVADGLVTEPTRLTVDDFLTQWLRDSVTPSSRANTVATYSSLTRTHVLPRLGALKLSALRPAHLQALYAAMLAAGKSPATVRLVHAMVHRAFDQATKWNYLARNPAGAVDPPAEQRQEMQTLDPDQVRALIAGAEAAGDRWAALWRLLVDTGARIGEALGLTWADVDLDRGGIAIRHTLTRVDAVGTPRFNEPKTARSVRTVTLTPATEAALRVHRARQAADRLAAGPVWADYGLVFASQVGTARTRSAALYAFRVALTRAGLPAGLRLHDLRHTSATLMLLTGTPARVAADRLGHSSVGITLDRYSHVTPTMEADAVNRLARVLDGTN
jgi:integrase